MRRRIPRVLATIALVASMLSGRASADDVEDDYVGPRPWHADADTIFLRRVIRASDGTPVAGATVRLFPEVSHPEPGFGTPAATGSSGADGWVRIPRSALDRAVTDVYGDPVIAYVEAERLSPRHEWRSFVMPNAPDVALEPSSPFRIALLDPLDRPVAGALLGYFLGCGHTPDVRQGVTGADGEARLDGVVSGTSEIWPRAHGLRSKYLHDGHVWGRARSESLEWGMNVEGTLLDLDGTPIVGAAIGVHDHHRGPWTRTDASGRFRLIGSEARVGSTIYAEIGEHAIGKGRGHRDAPVETIPFEAPPDGRSVIVRRPKPPVSETEEPLAVARVRVEAELSAHPAPTTGVPARVTAYLVRDEDGRTFDGIRDEDGSAFDGVRDVRGPFTWEVLPGSYVIHAFGREDEGDIAWSTARVPVVVPASGVVRARIELPPPAIQPLVVDGTSESFDSLALVTEGASTNLLPSLERATRFEVLVPTDRDVVLRATRGGRVRRTFLDRSTLHPGARAPELRVPVFAASVVRATFLGPDGEPASGHLIDSSADESWRAEHVEPPGRDAATSATLSVLDGERVELILWPADRTRYAPSFLVVPKIPVEAGEPVDLGPLRFTRRPPPVHVADDADRPVGRSPDEIGHVRSEIRAYVSRGERGEALVVSDDVPGRIDDPWWAPGLVAQGALVRVGGVNRRLEGPGPWTVHAGVASLEIRGVGAAGEPIDLSTVVLDGAASAPDAPVARFPSLDAGPHEAIVEAEGRVSRRLRFHLARGDARVWTVRLR